MDHFSRRQFVGGLSMAGSAGLLGLRPDLACAEPPPETTTLRFLKVPAVCNAPQVIAGELLKGEGLTDVQYVEFKGTTLNTGVGSGEGDFAMSDAPTIIMDLEKLQVPIVILTGIHAGCYKLFGTNQVTSIRDLKGRTVSVPRLGFAHHAFVGSMAASVGLDPRRDINWVAHSISEAGALFAEGKIDAFMTFEPEGVKLRERKIGHVLIDTAVDRPWAQYFCCLVIGNREFVRKNPVATKRALRAILKASEICALEPERTARLLVDRGFTERYDHALQVLKEIPSYGKWRQYSAADSLRFYALRFHEGGFIKSNPQTLLAQSTDWRFLNELRKELKG
jgi:NitT/TauT family transport system substrate-binding protein